MARATTKMDRINDEKFMNDQRGIPRDYTERDARRTGAHDGLGNGDAHVSRRTGRQRAGDQASKRLTSSRTEAAETAARRDLGMNTLGRSIPNSAALAEQTASVRPPAD